jgi:tetratricopeptide (TPR) repeat protein
VLVRLLSVGGLWLCVGITAVAGDLGACESARDYRYQATASYRRGDLSLTVNELRQAIALCPAEPFYKFMLANALYRAGYLQQSAGAYESYLQSQPSHFEAHMCLGFVSFELGDLKKSVEHWTAAVRLQPESPFAHAALAAGLYSIQDVDNARIQYQVATAIDARYAAPEELAIDVRWKAPIRTTLGAVKHLVESEIEGEK